MLRSLFLWSLLFLYNTPPPVTVCQVVFGIFCRRTQKKDGSPVTTALLCILIFLILLKGQNDLCSGGFPINIDFIGNILRTVVRRAAVACILKIFQIALFHLAALYDRNNLCILVSILNRLSIAKEVLIILAHMDLHHFRSTGTTASQHTGSSNSQSSHACALDEIAARNLRHRSILLIFLLFVLFHSETD